jgi:hypothetical protein
MSLGMSALIILLFVVSGVLSMVGYYLGSGEKLWKKKDKDESG